MNKLNPDSSQHKFNGGYFDKMYMINLLHERYREDQLFLDNNPKLIQVVEENKELTNEKQVVEENKETDVLNENIYPSNEIFEVNVSDTLTKFKVNYENLITKKKVDNIIKLKRW
jgi:hypothetical protein